MKEIGGKPTPEQRAAALRFGKLLAQTQLERGRLERGTFFDVRTVDALIACGIYDPECLLRMTRKQIAAIPGIGKASMAQIDAYRERFGHGDLVTRVAIGLQFSVCCLRAKS